MFAKLTCTGNGKVGGFHDPSFVVQKYSERPVS